MFSETFVNLLVASRYNGEYFFRISSRLAGAFDNGIYQILPSGILYPKTRSDIDLIFSMASREDFQSLTFTPRGGGTGTNGQSLNTGIIIDTSRYMTHILEINDAENWVRVEPRVVLDQLNEALRPYGKFFAPSLSPSSRATLGGMIATDASGKGSKIYGKTSQHILEMTCHLPDGRQFTSREYKIEGGRISDTEDEFIQSLYRNIAPMLENHSQAISKPFPDITRFVTGYNLKHVIQGNRFNLNALIAGSEGTLCFVSEAKLKLTPLPKAAGLLAIRYPNFPAALASAEQLLQKGPSALETMDHTILRQAKNLKLSPLIRDFLAGAGPNSSTCINLVEFCTFLKEKPQRSPVPAGGDAHASATFY